MVSKIVIYGTGKIARRMFYKYQNENYIVNWYDDEAKQDELYQTPIMKKLEKKCNQIVIVADANWTEKCEKLNERHWVMGEDYIPYWLEEYKMINWGNFFN